jgi:hypothetical protein
VGVRWAVRLSDVVTLRDRLADWHDVPDVECDTCADPERIVDSFAQCKRDGRARVIINSVGDAHGDRVIDGGVNVDVDTDDHLHCDTDVVSNTQQPPCAWNHCRGRWHRTLLFQR